MPETAATDFDFESYITDIPDYPEPGVVFKDITPLLPTPMRCDRLSPRLQTTFAVGE